MKLNQRRRVLGVLASVGIVGLGACGAIGDGADGRDFGSSSVGFAESASEDVDWDIEEADYAGGDSGESGTVSKIAVSGQADVITKDPQGAAKDFREAVIAAGGIIDHEWTQDDPGYLLASVTARVPVDEYEGITNLLSDLGRIQSYTTSSDDLSQQYIDYSARRGALEDSIVRIKRLADEATNTQDLLQAEELLAQQQADLDSLTQQLQWIDRQVDMSTLSVSFSTEQVGTVDSPLSWAWSVNLLVVSLRAILTVVIVLIPWVAIGLIIFFIVRGIVRLRPSKSEPDAVSSGEALDETDDNVLRQEVLVTEAIPMDASDASSKESTSDSPQEEQW